MARGRLMPQTEKTARIILEDGTEFDGLAFGHDSSVAGEIICVTGMADMARLLSDPALKGMIVVLSQPVAGATGIPEDELCPLGLETAFESPAAQISVWSLRNTQKMQVTGPQVKVSENG